MARKTKKPAVVDAQPTREELAQLYARTYEVLKTKNAKPVQLIDCRVAKPGEKFLARSILCFPQQLDTLLAMENPYVKAVE